MNDKVYQFFLDMEMRVRKLHPCLMKPADDTMPTKEDVMQSLLSDDVLFSWTIVTSEFDDEDLSSELLYFIINLWLTVRGHSAAGAWSITSNTTTARRERSMLLEEEEIGN